MLRRACGISLAVAASLILGACSGSSAPPRADRGKRPTTATPSEFPEEGRTKKRQPTRPELRIDNQGHTRADRGRVARAIRTLKALGFWDDLTDHLYSVVVRTRPGERRKPADGHLADSLFTVRIGPGPDGLVCDVVIFSEALADDVVLQNSYYAQGSLSSPPPTLRQFWAVILGHELAHCTDKGQKGEKRSTRWEKRILRAMGAGRVSD
jgi:hypothetical protein